MSTKKKNPAEFLKKIVGRPVSIKLSSGVVFTGILATIDTSMHVALEQAVEYLNGEMIEQHGDTFIRGNNIVHINIEQK